MPHYTADYRLAYTRAELDEAFRTPPEPELDRAELVEILYERAEAQKEIPLNPAAKAIRHKGGTPCQKTRSLL